jgi:hypothetical protein
MVKRLLVWPKPQESVRSAAFIVSVAESYSGLSGTSYVRQARVRQESKSGEVR